MSLKKSLSTASRVLQQLSHDPRTLAMVLIVPGGLMIILKYVFEGDTTLFNNIAPMILGIFPLTMMFIITSIATLRERTIGTLDRLMTFPISKLDFIFGYAIAFAVLSLLQAHIWLLTNFKKLCSIFWLFVLRRRASGVSCASMPPSLISTKSSHLSASSMT